LIELLFSSKKNLMEVNMSRETGTGVCGGSLYSDGTYYLTCNKCGARHHVDFAPSSCNEIIYYEKSNDEDSNVEEDGWYRWDKNSREYVKSDPPTED
jgi:hypothetical protein